MVWTFWQRSSFWGTVSSLNSSDPLEWEKLGKRMWWALSTCERSVSLLPRMEGCGCLSSCLHEWIEIDHLGSPFSESGWWNFCLSYVKLILTVSLYTHFSLCSTAWDYSYFWFFSLSLFLIQSFDFLSVTPVICQFCFPKAFKFVWCVMNNFFLMFCDRTFLG